MRSLIVGLCAAFVASGCIRKGDVAAQAPLAKSVDVSAGAVKVEVHNVAGSICVRRGEPGVVAVGGFARTWDFDDDAQARVDGAARDLSVVTRDGVIVVNEGGATEAAARDRKRHDDWDEDHFGDVTYDLELLVPEGTAVVTRNVAARTCVEGVGGSVDAESVSGDILVAGATVVMVTTVSGDASVLGARAIHVESISGDLVAEGIVEGAGLESVSGDVTIVGLGEDATVETTSGDISVTSALAADATWKLGSTSGDVELVLPADASFLLEHDSASGELSSDLPVVLAGTTSTVGNDPSALVTIETTSGDVRIRVGK